MLPWPSVSPSSSSWLPSACREHAGSRDSRQARLVSARQPKNAAAKSSATPIRNIQSSPSITAPTPIRHISVLSRERTASPAAVERAVELLTMLAAPGTR